MGLARLFTRSPDGAEMHFNFDFSTRQVLWTLNFAAQLVLLVVLLGRDRARRYPWFTAGIGLFALQLLAEDLLAGRMARLPFQEIVLVYLSDLGVIVGLLVLVEVARRAFAGAKRSIWIVNTVGLLVVAGGVLVVMGPWPAAKDLDLGSLLGRLRLMQLVAMKGETLVALLTVELGLLVVLFGRHLQGRLAKPHAADHHRTLDCGHSLADHPGSGAGHRQGGAPTQSAGVRTHRRPRGLMDKLMNANSMIYVAVVLWWIAGCGWTSREPPRLPQPRQQRSKPRLPSLSRFWDLEKGLTPLPYFISLSSFTSRAKPCSRAVLLPGTVLPGSSPARMKPWPAPS